MSAKMNLIVVFALVAALGALVFKKAEAGYGMRMPFSVHRAWPHEVAPEVMAKFTTVEDCWPVGADVCHACCKKFNLGSWTVFAAHSGKRHCECNDD